MIELQDAKQQIFTGGALTRWGGFILDPFALIEVPGTEQARWVIDPFRFLEGKLATPRSCRPLMSPRKMADACFSRTSMATVFHRWPNSRAARRPPRSCSRKFWKNIASRPRFRSSSRKSRPKGLHPKQSPQLEDIARRMFRLPHVEIASHTFAHPFLWDHSVKHGVFKDGKEEYYHLNVPGYRFDLDREIVGSMNYIRQRLAPPDKPVRILLWSGDTAPGADALEITERSGFLNMNGGDTSITRSNPSLTAVGALGIQKNGYLQVYAPITNENIYTNLWRGPYYGFERVTESFEMTESPRRLKPVDIYYHTYSASKPAGVKALHRVFAWTQTQLLHPVFASEYHRPRSRISIPWPSPVRDRAGGSGAMAACARCVCRRRCFRTWHRRKVSLATRLAVMATIFT